MLPTLHEGCEVRELHGLDLLPECGKCAPPSNLDEPSRAPLDVLQFPSEFSANELTRCFPLGEPRLDPIRLPAIPVVNLGDRDRTRLSEKTRQNLAARYRGIDRGMQQNIRHESWSLLLDQLGRSTHSLQILRPECRDISRIGLGQDEAPFFCPLRSEVYRDHATACQQLREWIAAYAFFSDSNSRAHFFAGQISGPVQQVRELVGRSCAPAGRRAATLSQRLFDCLECDVVASFPTHHFIEKGPVQREQRGTLLGARSIVAVKPVHHKAELQAGREWRG